MSKFEKLTSPIQIGKLKLKNRMVKAPQSTKYCTPDNMITDRIVATYDAIAAGGASLIILGACCIRQQHPDTQFVGLYDDRFIPGMQRLTEAVHNKGAYIIAQIYHGGPNDPKGYNGIPVAASAISKDELPTPLFVPTRALSLEEIKEYRQKFIDAALRAQKSGFDGVEVHGAHSYFLDSFLSRVWNRRTDEYGPQTYENRTRLVVEIIRGIKDLLGSDFVVGIRVNGEEFGHENRITREESAEMAKYYEKAGVDYIGLTGYGYGNLPFQYVPDYWPYPEPDDFMKPLMDDFRGQGIITPGAAAIKQVVSVPVITVGRLDEKLGEEILQQGKADLIYYGRQIWADPEFPNKVIQGRTDDIIRCCRCATCEDPQDAPRRCRVNPSLGREKELAILPAEKKKKVIVVGGGPAGMEAARVAALRGHQVTLYEKSFRLGGKLHLATMIKGVETDYVPSVIDYLSSQVNKLPINVHLKKEVNAGSILHEAPDVVLVATGGRYALPDIRGIDNPIVADIPSLSKQAELPLKLFGSAWLSKLSHIALPGIGKKVVIIGGQIEGLQGAVFLRKRGRDVTVIDASDAIGKGVPPRYLNRMLPWLGRKGVRILTEVKYEEITPKGIKVTQSGNSQFFEADTILVLMMESDPDHRLMRELKDRVPEIYAIGSSNGGGSGLIVHALEEGRQVGCRI